MMKAGLIVAAALLSATHAFAQNAPEPPPKPDAGATAQTNCIDEEDHYRMDGKKPVFFIALTNKCEARLRCKVFANVSSARGSALGHSTLVLAPKSRGAAAKQTFTMRVKMIGGNSMSDRECRVF